MLPLPLLPLSGDGDLPSLPLLPLSGDGDLEKRSGEGDLEIADLLGGGEAALEDDGVLLPLSGDGDLLPLPLLPLSGDRDLPSLPCSARGALLPLSGDGDLEVADLSEAGEGDLVAGRTGFGLPWYFILL